MANVYAERADINEAQSNFFWAKWDKVKSWVYGSASVAFFGIGTFFIMMSNGCQTQAENLNSQSEEKKQKGQQILKDSKENWKKEVKRIDSDSISITSSDDGEVVDLVA